MDWERDGSRTARIASMHWWQRYRTAVVAVRRLRKPLLEVDMPADWGIPLDVVGSLFETLLAEPTEALDHEVRRRAGELLRAPRFDIRAYGLGYFGSRNLESEFACHDAIVRQGSDDGFFSSAVARELVTRGDEYSAEVATALRRFLP